MSSGGEDDRSPIASRRATADPAERSRRGKAKRDLRSPSYLPLRNREVDSGRRSRSPTSRRRARRSSRRYFDDQVERHSRSRSRSPRRRRRARSNSFRDEEEPDRRGRSPSLRRRRAPRSCRSRSRTRSEECEDRSCCRPRSPGPGDGDGDGDGGEVNMSSPPAVDDSYVRIDRPDDLFKCAHCFEPLSSPVYECVDGHVTCSVCHEYTNEVEDGDDKCSQCGSTEYRRSRAVAAWLRSVRFPCDNHDYGCPAFLPHHQGEAHDRSCRYAPVFCPARRCDFHGGPTEALERHLTAVHGGDWSVVDVRYGHPLRVRARPTRSLLRAAEDGALFHLFVEMGYHGGAALSMIRIRPDNAPAAEFTYEVKTIAAPGMQHRLQMQSTLWGTSLRDGVVGANPVSVTVPDDMLPPEGPEQDAVEVRIVKVAPAGDRNNNN